MDSTQRKEAFIPEGMTIKGNISVDGDLTFAGNLDGNLDVSLMVISKVIRLRQAKLQFIKELLLATFPVTDI